MQLGSASWAGRTTAVPMVQRRTSGYEPIEQARREAVMRAAAEDRQAQAQERQRMAQEREAQAARNAQIQQAMSRVQLDPSNPQAYAGGLAAAAAPVRPGLGAGCTQDAARVRAEAADPAHPLKRRNRHRSGNRAADRCGFAARTDARPRPYPDRRNAARWAHAEAVDISRPVARDSRGRSRRAEAGPRAAEGRDSAFWQLPAAVERPTRPSLVSIAGC